MNEKKINFKKTDGLNSSTICSGNKAVNNKKESYVIPLEAACSHEFSKGCYILEDEANKLFDEK